MREPRVNAIPDGHTYPNEADWLNPWQWAEQNLSRKELLDVSGQHWSLKNDFRPTAFSFCPRDKIIQPKLVRTTENTLLLVSKEYQSVHLYSIYIFDRNKASDI